MAAEQDERIETCLIIDTSQGMSIPDGAVQPASGHVQTGRGLKDLVAAALVRRGRRVRAGRGTADRRPKEGDSTRRASTAVGLSAPGRVAVRGAQASAAHDRRAAAVSAAHDRRAAAVSAACAPALGRVALAAVASLAHDRVASAARDPKAAVASLAHDRVASEARDPGPALVALAAHDPGLARANSAISGRAVRVRRARATGADRPGHARKVQATTTPVAATKALHARSGRPPLAAATARLPGATSTGRAAISTRRAPARTAVGIRMPAPVRRGPTSVSGGI